MGSQPGRATASEARRSAQAVAERCGLEIVAPLDPAQQREAVALLARIWGLDSPDSLISPPLLRALEYSGNYVAGAYRNGAIVGAGTAFFGRDHLHSDLLGVAAEHQGSGIGYALKQHQRAWALSQGLTEIRWTYDPLLRANAHFNLHKLGARAFRYLPDFYGPGADRLYVRWPLSAPPATPAGDELLVPLAGDLRDTLIAAFDDGYEIADFRPDNHYVLIKGLPTPR